MRVEKVINREWLFTKEHNVLFASEDIQAELAEIINIPHTWNAFDGQDGGNDYYRGICWYQKRLDLPEIAEREALYLEFEGANSVAKVYLNGNEIGFHEGGYSVFRFDISAFAGITNALLSVSVDNSDNPHVYPRTADYTFFGGIYRDVKLIKVNRTHFALNRYGAKGVYIDTEVAGNDVKVIIQSEVENGFPEMRVQWEITDVDGKCHAMMTDEWKKEAVVLELADVKLWNGIESPYMYKAKGILLDKAGNCLDELEIPFGIRFFSVDSEKGFFLNGKSYPLHGVSRHQDRKDKGWAISKEDHIEDMELIAEIGANSIRLAHYQHDAYFYDLCDSNGMVVWAEIPFISRMSKTKLANENLISQMSELVLQNYNHPSICFWGVENEAKIQLAGKYEDDLELVEMVQKLQDLCKKLNPSRLTCQACIGNVPGDSALAKATELVSFNLYYGWYNGEIDDLALTVDKIHQDCPELTIGISEYGADGSIRYHNDKPRVNDYTEDYQAILHEKSEAILNARPFIWSHYVWNMFDFGSDRRDEGGAPGLNQKGLVTYDRKVKKDAFYLYKAYWSQEPFVHICGHTYLNRVAGKRTVKVYSNQPRITLTLNGNVIESLEANKVFEFEIELGLGKNILKVSAREISEELVINGIEKYDKSYKMTELEGKAGIVNWFENADDFHFVSGTYSVNDRIADIMENEEAWKILENSLSPVMDISLIKMVKNLKLAKALMKYGQALPAEFAVNLNDELSKIQKAEEDVDSI